MHSDDGRQQGVQQAASVQEDKAALAAEADQGLGSVVCGRFKPASDGGGMEQNERESPSKMTRQVLGTRALLVGIQPASQSTAGNKCRVALAASTRPLDGRQTDAKANAL